MRFTVYTTCYNAGAKLNKTIQSVLAQTYADYEIIIKDGKSTDGCVDDLLQDPEVTAGVASGNIRLMVEPDQGVYDGMNQALAWIRGDYVIFLNCGDTFFDENVLLRTSAFIESQKEMESFGILYGDVYCQNRQAIDAAPVRLDRFQCYRNIPCHQACFYKRELLTEKQYDTTLRIRADYDHFLWCIFKRRASYSYLGFCISKYEGDGISEKKENVALDHKEHLEVLRRYMGEREIKKYQMNQIISLASLRKRVARSRTLSKIYYKAKEMLIR